ncbi:hypothetical protein BDB00DRAFT_791316 [Zychaea mexicana]|uniref:uncharacterized protein n=1 Tax=Zychaea mexicana TaxID=64656 RepID=UPI0022FEBD6A|nr:uncharacterized protein BDB00DRAFT_791316 [Zychaea mexicana]KAI9489178.1 hypothetical protein BDB00DRAFT_791316 [Zychaea mexicana]
MAQETSPLLRWMAPPIAWLRKLQDISVSNKPSITIVTAVLLGNVNAASNTNGKSKKRFVQRSLQSLPTEVALEAFARLDSATLYQLTLVSRGYRHLLAHHEASRCWNALVFEPHIPLDDARINSMMRFLTKFQLHMYTRSAHFDGTTIDVTRLEKILRHLPYITQLSITHCPNLDCYQVLQLLKSSAKNTSFVDNNSIISTSSSHTGLAPFLQHLEQLYMQGLFPSERGQKSYAHEMYAYAGDGDFRPPWLPDELVQFIQVIEEQQNLPSEENGSNNNNNSNRQRRPIADVEPCHLCHKNVASTGSAAFLRGQLEQRSARERKYKSGPVAIICDSGCSISGSGNDNKWAAAALWYAVANRAVSAVPSVTKGLWIVGVSEAVHDVGKKDDRQVVLYIMQREEKKRPVEDQGKTVAEKRETEGRIHSME